MTGLVVCFGLLTIDHVMLVDRIPGTNEKMVAIRSDVDFGGPAANAAATASALGSPARLITAVGNGALTRYAEERLSAVKVELRDLLATESGDPAVSTILVTESTGDRAVVSTNARAARTDLDVEGDDLDDAAVLLVDGHHMAAATSLAREARDRGVLVVLDGGSWKPGTEELLPFVDVAVVSNDFRAPGDADVFDLLTASGCAAVARTAGADPIVGAVSGTEFEIEVPVVDDVVDSLGAGDVIHGALAHYLAADPRPAAVVDALRRAAAVASESCRHAGAHGWFSGAAAGR